MGRKIVIASTLAGTCVGSRGSIASDLTINKE
jgi:hypothetical protein